MTERYSLSVQLRSTMSYFKHVFPFNFSPIAASVSTVYADFILRGCCLGWTTHVYPWLGQGQLKNVHKIPKLGTWVYCSHWSNTFSTHSILVLLKLSPAQTVRWNTSSPASRVQGHTGVHHTISPFRRRPLTAHSSITPSLSRWRK